MENDAVYISSYRAYLFLIMAFNIHTIKKWVTVEIEERMVELASGYAEQFEGYLREVSQIAKSTATFIENRPDITSEQIFTQLRSNVNQNKLVYGAAIGFEPYQYESDHLLFAPYVYRGKEGLMQMDIGIEGYDYTHPQWKWWNKPKYQNKARKFLVYIFRHLLAYTGEMSEEIKIVEDAMYNYTLFDYLRA